MDNTIQYIQQLNANITTLQGWINTNASKTGEIGSQVEAMQTELKRLKAIQIEIQNGSGVNSFWELVDTPDALTCPVGSNLVVGPGDTVICVPDGQEDVWVVADITERDALPIGLLDDEVSDGDIVKVLDSDGAGTPATYAWDETTSSWVVISIGGKVTPQIALGVTAVPTAVSPIGFMSYHQYMDTSAGDIDLSSIGIVAGVPDGAKLHFHNAGSGELTYTDARIPDQYKACLGDILSLEYKADTMEWIIC